MLTVAVTGGIGSGKSTAAAALADLGAVVVDSDRLAREVVAPGTAGLAAVTEEFGPGVLAGDGSLDRAALARIVFHDDDARRRLEAITHPRVRAAFQAARESAGRHAIVVNDIPLLRTLADAARFHLVITIAADDEVRVSRLLARGVAEPDARARMRAQLADDDRRPLSDVWLTNDGDEAALRRAIRALWSDRLVPFEDNLVAGRAAAGSDVRAASSPDAASPDASSPQEALPALLRARIAAATGGLPCDVVPPQAGAGGGPAAVVWVPSLAAADDLAPALAAAGFPRVDRPVSGIARAGGSDAGPDTRSGSDASGCERRHASADPGRSLNLYLKVKVSAAGG